VNIVTEWQVAMALVCIMRWIWWNVVGVGRELVDPCNVMRVPWWLNCIDEIV